jgi:hypothetical protein
VTLYGEAVLSSSPACAFQYLLLSVPEGWVVPGRGLLSREGVAAGIFGRDEEERAGEIFLPEEEGNRYLLLRFIPSGPPGVDGFLHFTYVNGAVIAYDPKTGAATFTIILQTSWLESRGAVPVTARGLSLIRSDKGGRGRESLLSTQRAEISIAMAQGTPAARRVPPLRAEYWASGEGPEPIPAGARIPGAASAPEDGRGKDGIRMDFPALGRGDRVIGLTFRTPDRDKGRILYNGAPVPADPGGAVTLGGDFFQPAKISFRAAGSWKGIVRLGFIAIVRHEPTGAEREVPGAVTFISASRKGRAKKSAGGKTAKAAGAQIFCPAPDPSLFAEIAEGGTAESADVWSAFSRLTLSDCLAQTAEDLDVDLLPRRAYLQEYRVFSGNLADQAVPWEVLRTEDSAPAGFRMGGLEQDLASLLGPEGDFIPLPVVRAYAMPLGSFLPGGGVFGGLGAEFSPVGEDEAVFPSLEEDSRMWSGGNEPPLRGDFLMEDGDLDFSRDFLIPDAAGVVVPSHAPGFAGSP